LVLFFKKELFPSCACLAVGFVCAGSGAAHAAAQQVAPGVFVRMGVTADATAANQDAIANTGFIVGDNAVAVIDPGGSLADGNALRADVRAQTALPVRYVIITHVHPDHSFGAAAFLPDHPVFVGHAKLPGALAARGDYYRDRLVEVVGAASAGQPVIPTRLVAATDHIDLGGRVLDLQAYPPAHTDNDLTVMDTKTSTLWAGDLVFVGRVPSLDGDLKGWIAALHTLQSVHASRVVPGHGPTSVPWPDAGADEERYLALLLHDVRASIAAGQDIGDAVKTAAQSERGKWALFDDYNGHNVTVAFKELEWE
jgi:quinoprotein relay system zinc metallohydrolase 2